MLDPYETRMFAGHPFGPKRPIVGRVVAVLNQKLQKRGLELIQPISRVMGRHEIHELMVTSDENAGPGATVDPIAYLCFFEIVVGGVMVRGDRITIENQRVGHVAGFDGTHLPNHINVVLKGPTLVTGVELDLQVEDEFVCSSPCPAR